MSSHPIRKAQPKIGSSAPADALSALSEAGLLHVSCQLYSCLYVPGWQLFLFFLFTQHSKLMFTHVIHYKLQGFILKKYFPDTYLHQLMTWWCSSLTNSAGVTQLKGKLVLAETLMQRSNMLLLCVLGGSFVCFGYCAFSFIGVFLFVLNKAGGQEEYTYGRMIMPFSKHPC